jgi:hypothetical protein
MQLTSLAGFCGEKSAHGRFCESFFEIETLQSARGRYGDEIGGLKR